MPVIAQSRPITYEFGTSGESTTNSIVVVRSSATVNNYIGSSSNSNHGDDSNSSSGSATNSAQHTEGPSDNQAGNARNVPSGRTTRAAVVEAIPPKPVGSSLELCKQVEGGKTSLLLGGDASASPGGYGPSGSSKWFGKSGSHGMRTRSLSPKSTTKWRTHKESINLCSTSLEAIKDEALFVRGSLLLRDCKELKALPQKLAVGGDLDLRGCVGLEQLPRELYVKGDLQLSQCTNLAKFPERLRVGGSVFANSLDSLTSVTPSLVFTTGKNLIFSHCPELEALPEGLSVGGTLNIYECNRFTSMPSMFGVKGDICITYCRALESLPERKPFVVTETNAYVQNSYYAAQEEPLGNVLLCCFGLAGMSSLLSPRTVALSGCPNLKRLPPGMVVTGDLILNNCSSLRELPSDLQVGRALMCANCVQLRSIPKDMHVWGQLDLTNCTSLTELPRGLRVSHGRSVETRHTARGDLRCENCTSLTTLPYGLKVAGHLILMGCSSLRMLPEKLDVGGSLRMENCRAFEELPRNFKVEGSMFFTNCTSLRSLPSSFLSSMRIRVGDLQPSVNQTHHVVLEGTAIPEQELNRLRRTLERHGRDDVILHVSAPVGHEGALNGRRGLELRNLQHAISHWTEVAFDEDTKSHSESFPSHVDLEKLLSSDETRLLLSFLSRLCNTAEYRNKKTRIFLARRVLYMLDQLIHNEKFRERAMLEVSTALDTCDDRVIWALDQIELAIRIDEARSSPDPEEAIRKLGRGFYILDIIRQHALQKGRELRVYDELEVHLFLVTRLAEEYDLPINTRNMLHVRCARCDDRDLDNMRKEIDAKLADEHGVEQFLATFEPLHVVLREGEARAFQYTDINHVARLPLGDDPPICPITHEMMRSPHDGASEREDVSDGERRQCDEDADYPHWVCIGDRMPVYQLDALLQHWINTGWDPVSKASFQLADLRKVEFVTVSSSRLPECSGVPKSSAAS